MNVVIAGGGKVGRYLARELSGKGHAVSIIERRKDRAEEIAAELEDVIVILGDACDSDYLEPAGIERADVLAAVTGDDDDNFVISQLAKDIYKVRKVIARVNNPKNEQIFKVLNVDAPVSATGLIAKIVEEEVSIDELFTVLALSGGKFRIVETRIPEKSPVVGQKVQEIGIPRDCILVAIERNGDIIIPRGSSSLFANDKVYAITTPEKEKALAAALKGKAEQEACEL